MFSSRTLAERNNDPAPWLDPATAGDMEEIRWGDVDRWGKAYYKHEPRTQFQHGVLPENPILVAFRNRPDESVMWATLERQPTQEEKSHAYRVLRLRATLKGADK